MKRCEACGELNNQDAKGCAVCKSPFTPCTDRPEQLRDHTGLGNGNYLAGHKELSP